MSDRNNEARTETENPSNDLLEAVPHTDDFEAEDSPGETAVAEAKTENSDNVGGSSVELDVEQLLAEVESEAPQGVDANGRVRRRLEAIMERKRRHEALMDFDEYDLDS